MPAASSTRKKTASTKATKNSGTKKRANTNKTSSTRASSSETYSVQGGQLVKKVKQLLREGNVRKITVLNKKGETLLIVPVTAGVLITLFAPYLVVLAGLGALLTECSIKVERKS